MSDETLVSNGGCVNGGTMESACSDKDKTKASACSDKDKTQASAFGDKDKTKASAAPRIEDELVEFDSVFARIVNDLCGDSSAESMQKRQALDWYKQVLLYNVPHGKKNRGITVVHSYKLLTAASHADVATNGDTEDADDTLFRVRVLGWCVEILQAYFLVADDIMDQSETRRGQLCWYKKDGVGLMAVNDALFLENCIYQLLYKYLRRHPAYPHLLHLFHQTNYHTITGQTLDMLSTTNRPRDGGGVDLSQYTAEKYTAIAKFKTAYYSFYLPVALAMHLSGECSEDEMEGAKEILLLMGHYFQVQDDYLDCFGDVAVTGKVGTDIEEAKCSWLMVQAVKLANEEQREILRKCYGSSDASSVEAVKSVYKEVGMRRVYEEYEEECYGKLLDMIQTESTRHHMPKLMFIQLANKIYKRQK